MRDRSNHISYINQRLTHLSEHNYFFFFICSVRQLLHHLSPLLCDINSNWNFQTAKPVCTGYRNFWTTRGEWPCFVAVLDVFIAVPTTNCFTPALATLSRCCFYIIFWCVHKIAPLPSGSFCSTRLGFFHDQMIASNQLLMLHTINFFAILFPYLSQTEQLIPKCECCSVQRMHIFVILQPLLTFPMFIPHSDSNSMFHTLYYLHLTFVWKWVYSYSRRHIPNQHCSSPSVTELFRQFVCENLKFVCA